jgi:GWxTD domain-containing protein
MSRAISLALTTLLAAPVAGQAGRFEMLRDSLAHNSDPAALRARLTAPPDRSIDEVSRGLILFRLYQLTHDDNDLDAAGAAFDRAAEANGRNAWAQYGRALVEANSADVRSIGLVQTGRSLAKELGLDARSKARRSVERALQLDRTLGPAAALFADLAVLGRDPDEMQKAGKALDAIVRTGNASEEELTSYSRLLVAMDAAGQAVDEATKAIDIAPASPDARYALAIALLNDKGGAEDGAALYFELVDALTPSLADRLYEEVRWIATPREREAWDSATIDKKKAWFREFWDVRAAMSAEPVAARLAEHYRRLTISLNRYARQSDGPQPGETLMRERDPSPFDDRGIIYLRHGEPNAKIRTAVIKTRAFALMSTACQITIASRDPSKWGTHNQGAARENESWVYTDLDGRYRMYNFLQCQGFPDYVIPWEIPCDTSQYEPFVQDRIAYESEIRSCGGDTRERIRDYAREALTTDTDRPDFARNVPLILDLLAFRGRNGLTELTSPLAVSIDSLGPRNRRPGTYRLNFTVAVVDTASRSLSRKDTSIFAAPSTQAKPGEWLNTFVRLEAKPAERSELRISMRDETSDAGAFFGTSIGVPDFNTDSLSISSIALALPGVGDWRRGDARLRLMPYGEYEGGTFLAYYEVYNLADSASYETEVLVQPMREGPRDPARPPADVQEIRLRFTDEAHNDTDGAVRQLRRIESELPPGRYRITVTVTDGSGRKVGSWRQFVIPEQVAAGGN